MKLTTALTKNQEEKAQSISNLTNDPLHSNTSSKFSFQLTIENNEVLVDYKWI